MTILSQSAPLRELHELIQFYSVLLEIKSENVNSHFPRAGGNVQT